MDVSANILISAVHSQPHLSIFIFFRLSCSLPILIKIVVSKVKINNKKRLQTQNVIHLGLDEDIGASFHLPPNRSDGKEDHLRKSLH